MTADFGESLDDLYRAGLDDDLVGRRATALAATSSRARFQLDGGGLLGSVDPRGPVVPAFITGTVGSVPAGSRLAVAVNGRVAALAFPYQSGGQTRFGALVPPDSFVRGENAVGVVMVTGHGRERRYRMLRDATVAYRLVRDGDRETLVAGTGRRIAVTPGAVEGHVDELKVLGSAVTIAGWAGSKDPARAAQRVVAFAGDRFLWAATPDVRRPDLERAFGGGLARAGFALGGEGESPETRGASAGVRVYAILGSDASALPLPEDG
jgi:hypothetical protein